MKDFFDQQAHQTTCQLTQGSGSSVVVATSTPHLLTACCSSRGAQTQTCRTTQGCPPTFGRPACCSSRRILRTVLYSAYSAYRTNCQLGYQLYRRTTWHVAQHNASQHNTLPQDSYSLATTAVGPDAQTPTDYPLLHSTKKDTDNTITQCSTCADTHNIVVF